MQEQQITRITKWQLGTLLVALIVEFVLGIALTNLINYNPAHPTLMQILFLVLHMLVAAVIIIGGSVRLAQSVQFYSLRWESVVGFVAILGAFTAGIEASKSGSNVSAFLMALCFLIAFLVYGYSFVLVKARR